MPSALDDLLTLLDLELLEHDYFRGQSASYGAPRVFGGQVLAQAVIAAGRTVPEDRRCHSLHAYFILPGDAQAPILYHVDRLRDGGSFATRRVTAIQHGRPIFNAALSFHREEPGLDHADPAPEAVPAPGEVTSEVEIARALADRIPRRFRATLTGERAIDYRPVDPVNPFAPEATEAELKVWLQASGELADDPLIHQALLAYASDYGLLGTALRPHARSVFDPGIMAASLDHAIWFHRPFRIDGWLLYTMDSPSASGGRAFTRGAVHDAEGRLVASATQEGLVRLMNT
ncbi:acyl-CoA thioesterase [Rubricoccus marinus]|uniref:Acyl-CoA thioesterase 2 n=1 Tax=Rubricoccus marinus TaxID=716817 RepID=A0A259U1Z4_9BACT|nr:acyl-CoA thioesterase II [Rubricoccus marinus]OZC03857.1 acyl-CoA thioesterase II [Rubricoccus marinus]